MPEARATVASLKDSVRLRLAALLMLAVTGLTGAIGLWSYELQRDRLIESRLQFEREITQQLARPMASAMWNFDRTAARVLMEAKLGAVVHGITAKDPEGNVWLERTSASPTPEDPSQLLVLELPQVDGSAVGSLVVRWSDSKLEKANAQSVRVLVVQMVALNVLLLVVLWVGVDRLLLRRLATLQLALDQAASHEQGSQVVDLPVRRHDEFGAITNSINAITHRLRTELAAGLKAEQEARESLSTLRSAQESLVRAEKMAALGNLVAGVSHELNTPIGNIVMVASTQQERVRQFGQDVAANKVTRKGLQDYLDQSREGAEIVFNSATRAADLIQSFKQVAVDQASERLRSFDLATQLAEIISITSPLFSKSGVEVQRDLAGGILMKTYPGPLGQVVTNMLANAVLHGLEKQADGIIKVSCRQHMGRAVIEVQDNGCGMAPDVQSKIFDPFFTTKLGRGGSGLGLHICHNLVYGPLQGSLRVQSEVGLGTTFTIEIPCQISA
jgi:two-component system NtrC family sensor kinase